MHIESPEEYNLDIYPDTEDEQLCPASCRHCPYGARSTPPQITGGYSREAYGLMFKLNEYLNQNGGRVTRINYTLQNPNLISVEPLPLEESPLALSLAIGTDPNLEPHMRLAEGLLKNMQGEATRLTFTAPHIEVKEDPIDPDFTRFLYRLTHSALISPVIGERIDSSHICVGLNRNDVDPTTFNAITGNSNWTVFRQIAIESILKEYLRANITSVAHSSAITGTQCHHETSMQNDEKTISVWGRYIKYEPPQKQTVFAPFLERAELSRMGTRLVLALLPKEVWVGHSTKDTSDETVRFTYPDFTKILEESIQRETSLIEGLGEAIAKRRNDFS